MWDGDHEMDVTLFCQQLWPHSHLTSHLQAEGRQGAGSRGLQSHRSGLPTPGLSPAPVSQRHPGTHIS